MYVCTCLWGGEGETEGERGEKQRSSVPLVYIFIYLFRDRMCEREGAQAGRAERRRDRIPKRLHAFRAELAVRLELTHCEIVT